MKNLFDVTLRLMLLVATLAVLISCSSAHIVGDEMESKADVIAGKSSSYQQGFRDGCYSGVYEAREMTSLGDEFRRDDQRFAVDSQYQLGWLDGNRACLMRFGGARPFFVMPVK